MEARLRPLTISGEQTCRHYVMTTDPVVPIFSYEQPDQMGLVQHFVIRNHPFETLTLTAKSEVETLHSNPFARVSLLAEDWEMLSDAAFQEAYPEWLSSTALVPLNLAWPGPLPEANVFAYGQALMNHIYRQFQYVPGATEISTPLAQFVTEKRGVCQDYAHLMLSVARSHGVPARYVSGYVYSGDPASNRAGESQATQGGGATHAWVELYLPHDGIWMGFDPTNNVVVADKHIKIGVGRDYSDVPPTHGLLRAARGQKLPSPIDLVVAVEVKRYGQRSGPRPGA